MAWGLHDTHEVEKLGKPIVLMLTAAFQTAAQMRAKTLGLEGHPLVVMPHPLASRTEAEVKAIAATLVDGVAAGLMKSV